MSTTVAATASTSEADFPETPEGNASKWKAELAHAREWLKTCHEDGAKVVQRYLDERDKGDTEDVRWNLFTSSVEMKRACLYGQVPRISAARRHADAKDDAARVAGELLERILNADIERGDSFAQDLENVLDDRLLPGLGVARVRYEAEFEKVPEVPARMDPTTGLETAPLVPATERKTKESAPTDYIHWRDFLYSPARTWGEVRWVAFRAEMSKQQLEARFGEEVARVLPLDAQRSTGSARKGDDDKPRPWARATVWEVWDKETKRVYWVSESHPTTLDAKDDPLGLSGFFPCPRPLVSMATTTAFRPRAEYLVARDLYNEVDDLSLRIKLLTDAVKVCGVYDNAQPSIASVLTTQGNSLVPVDNWALLAEKGGLRGVIDWMPLEQVVGAIAVLSERRTVAMDAIREVTGMADVMRGTSVAGETATTSAVKANFGSARLRRLQDEFARFASEVQNLKAEVVCKHFEPQTILEQSNALMAFAPEEAMRAVELLKSGASTFRVEVKPEALALQDFSALKSEALELVQALVGMFQGLAPLAQAMPGAMPFALELVQASLARMKGAATFESVLDRAIEASKQAPPPGAQQGPSPEQMRLQAVQMKGQLDLERERLKLQGAQQQTVLEVQADAQREANQREQNVLEAAQKHALVATGRGGRGMDGKGPGGAL